MALRTLITKLMLQSEQHDRGFDRSANKVADYKNRVEKSVLATAGWERGAEHLTKKLLGIHAVIRAIEAVGSAMSESQQKGEAFGETMRNAFFKLADGLTFGLAGLFASIKNEIDGSANEMRAVTERLEKSEERLRQGAGKAAKAESTMRVLKQLEDEVKTFGMSAAQKQVFELEQNNAPEKSIQRAKELSARLDALDAKKKLETSMGHSHFDTANTVLGTAKFRADAYMNKTQAQEETAKKVERNTKEAATALRKLSDNRTVVAFA